MKCMKCEHARFLNPAGTSNFNHLLLFLEAVVLKKTTDDEPVVSSY